MPHSLHPPALALRRFRRADVGVPERVAMLSMHTSPLEQPGTGDAGGMNVYVVELARRLAERGTAVEIFTRSTRGDQPRVVDVADGVLVRHVPAGPFEGLAKEDLPGQLCAFAAGVLRAEASRERGFYDLVHSHYWLSGQVGLLAAERWGVPLVHSMHTMAKVKNAVLAAGDRAEPIARENGERHLAAAADRLIANTDEEAAQLVELYGADPDAVSVAAPGVDLDVFRPGVQAAARRALGIPADAAMLLFVGRIQPLKAPDVLVSAVARMVADDPALRSRLVVVVVGGPSGSGLDEPRSLAVLAQQLGVADVVRFEPPVPRARLPLFYTAADLTVVPSRSESFGLVAIESQACGTPVVATRAGGLRTAVADGYSGVLVDGHDPGVWAATLAQLLSDPARRAVLSKHAVVHARGFGWDATASAVQQAYADTLALQQGDGLRAVGG